MNRPWRRRVLKRLTLHLLLVIGLLGLAACGSDGDVTAQDDGASPQATASESDSSASVEACSLLTPQEIGTTLGATVGEGKKDATSFPGPDCTWSWQSGFNNVFVSVSSLRGMQPDAWVDANRRTFERQGQDAVPEDKRTRFIVIDGVGDAAWGDQLIVDGSIQQVHASTGGTSVGISFTMRPRPPLEKATELLKIAVGRLAA
jgi:hypothetical protein